MDAFSFLIALAGLSEDGGGSGFESVVAWDGQSTPDVTKIPYGVSVIYSGTTYTGALAASSSTVGKIYLVYNTAGVQPNYYNEYITAKTGNATYTWELIGTTQIDLTDYEKKFTIKSSLDSPLQEHTKYFLGGVSTLSLVTPTTPSANGQEILVDFTASAAFTVAFSGGTLEGNTSLTTISGKHYQILFTSTGGKWWTQYLYC